MRAQVDYLQRLPHDMEKRKALEELPPDLPETYIRIFQAIDSAYGGKTKIYIQRLLRWLVLKITSAKIYAAFSNPILTAGALCQAICIENENDWPTAVNTPTVDQISRWLGCMIRVDQNDDTVHLSHFTVREFLTMSAERVPHSVAQKYLVSPKDEEYIANVCLIYSMHRHFEDAILLTSDNVEEFISEHPFWYYVASALGDHVSFLEGASVEGDRPLQRFLSMPACWGYKIWLICNIWLDEPDLPDRVKWESDYMSCLSPTLHFASIVGLPCQTRKLLEGGADANASNALTNPAVTPLHLAIYSTTGLWSLSDRYLYFDGLVRMDYLHENDDKSVQMSKILIEFGADIDRQVTIQEVNNNLKRVVTPLVFAVLCGNWEVASLLLAAGADWNATADMETKNCDDWCSIETLLDEFPGAEHILRRAAELGEHVELTKYLDEWRLRPEAAPSDSRTSSPSANDTNPQESFVVAFGDQDWEKVEEILHEHSNLEVNRLNEHGKGAIHYAAECKGSPLVLLLEHGADPNLRQYQGDTALSLAAQVGAVENIRILLSRGADVEARDCDGWTPLLDAMNHGQSEALQLLLDSGADLNATLDDGAGALHMAIENRQTEMFSLLLKRGIKSNLPDHYGSTPLHFACRRALDRQVEQLIEQMIELNHSLDDHSLIDGTPLYYVSRKGLDSIIRILLDHGAAIDKIGPGNLLGSALMTACAEGHSTTVKLLLSRGAAMEVEGSRFGSAIDTARVFRKEDIVKILEEHAQSRIEEEVDMPENGANAKRPGGEDDSEDPYPGAEQKGLTLRPKSHTVEMDRQ